MSRPINADTLTHILESCRDTAPVLGLQSIIAVDDAIQMVIDAPTIPAIPVEWLKNRRDIYLKAYHAGHESELHTAAILNDTLQAWQKEQEAKRESEI